MAIAAGARTYHQVRATVRVGFMPMTKIIYILAPVNLLCGYRFLPESAQVPASNAMSFLVGTYINTRIKKIRLAALRKKHFLEAYPSPDSNPASADPPPDPDPEGLLSDTQDKSGRATP
ncbi:hypothetical protein K449DRAFT_382391 [Hypoxylon sp. EC38]|nr:hypothetical protein K449DRAFT_382391 [Hypoxylon sp. EC38]